MRVAIYARVSTDAQEARGTIGSQLALLRERVSKEGHELVAEVYQFDWSHEYAVLSGTTTRVSSPSLRSKATMRSLQSPAHSAETSGPSCLTRFSKNAYASRIT